MYKPFICLVLALLIGGWLSPVRAADMNNQATLSTLAKIMHQLNHYPSDNDKKILKEIIDHTPENSRQYILAKSIMNLEHSVAPQDALKLKEIITDDSASEGERDLARIILDLNHKPSTQDKQRLQSMIR